MPSWKVQMPGYEGFLVVRAIRLTDMCPDGQEAFMPQFCAFAQ